MLIVLSVLFATILFLSIIRPQMNPGIPALVISLFLAPLIEHPSIGGIARLFPSSLFLTLLGVTFFFASLNSSGLIDVILKRILGFTKPFPKLVPWVIFALVAVFTAAGLGNIAAIALIAPLAIPLAKELGLSPFLMTLLIVGAANAASFSPLTLPGIFINEFIQKSEQLSKNINPATMRWWVFWLVFFSIAVTSLLSFFLLGGQRWFRQHSSASVSVSDSSTEHAGLTSQQKRSAIVAAAIASIFVIGCVAGLRFWETSVPPQILNFFRRFGEVGVVGWLGGFLMVSLGLSRPERDLKAVPWSTLILVCGMSTYIELLSRLGLPDAISALVQRSLPESLLPSAFAASSALLSAFSSSVGVALPVFMPIVESVSKELDPIMSQALTIAVAVGSHLVDASPLSTLGALCLAQIKDSDEQTRSYRALLIYSFAMIPVAGLWTVIVGMILKFAG